MEAYTGLIPPGQTIHELAENLCITGVKASSGDIVHLGCVLAAVPFGFAVPPGLDNVFLGWPRSPETGCT